MKNFRIAALLIALITVFSLASFTVSAQEETSEKESASQQEEILKSGKWQYKKLSKTTAELVSYLGNDSTCMIPEKIGGLKVVSVASGAIKNKTSVTTLNIPGNVSSFKANSVVGCKKLKTVTVVAGSLASFDLANCAALEVVNLPATIKSIGAFEGCNALKEINIIKNGTALKSIGGVVYSADGKTLEKYPAGKKMSRFTIPAGVTTVSDYAFSNTGTNVTEIFVPKAVVTMGAKAFSGAKVQLNFEASKLPSGCKTAVKGLVCKYNQINVYAPTKVASAQNASAIKLTWNKVTGASGYVVYYKNAKGAWERISVTTKTAITIKALGGKALKAGQKYTFAVKTAVKTSKGVQTSSNYITHDSATTPVATTKIISAADKLSVKLMWNKVAGASGYAIYRKGTDGKFKLITKTEKNTVTISKLSQGTEYTFAVRTYIKTATDEILGAYKTHKIVTKGIAVPVVTAKQIKSDTIEFTWSSCYGATSYQVYYSVNGSKYKVLGKGSYDGVKKLKISNSGFKKGMTVSLIVRAVKTEDGKVIRSGYQPVTVTIK